MTFLWDHFLWLPLAVPALVFAYLAVMRRRKKFAVRYASVSLVKPVLAERAWHRPTLPLKRRCRCSTRN